MLLGRNSTSCGSTVTMATRRSIKGLWHRWSKAWTDEDGNLQIGLVWQILVRRFNFWCLDPSHNNKLRGVNQTPQRRFQRLSLLSCPDVALALIQSWYQNRFDVYLFWCEVVYLIKSWIEKRDSMTRSWSVVGYKRLNDRPTSFIFRSTLSEVVPPIQKFWLIKMEPENVESPKPMPVVNPKNQVSAAKIYRLAIHRMPNWPNDFSPNAQVNDQRENLRTL